MEKENIQRKPKLNYNDIELLAEEIQYSITNGQPLAIGQYLELAKNITPELIGYRHSNAIINEPRLRSFFPDSVYAEIKNSVKNFKKLSFCNKDDEYIVKNRHMGAEWLAERFYTSMKNIRARTYRTNVKLIEQHNHEFTKYEDKFIIENENKSWQWIADHLNLTKGQVVKRGKKFGIDKSLNLNHHKYTIEDETFIRENINTLGMDELVKALNVTKSSLLHFINRHSIPYEKKYKLFSEYETQYVIKNYPHMGSEKVAKELNRSVNSIDKKVRQFKIKYTGFTPYQDVILTHYCQNGVTWLANELGMSKKRIRNRAKNLGIDTKKKPFKDRIMNQPLQTLKEKRLYSRVTKPHIHKKKMR